MTRNTLKRIFVNSLAVILVFTLALMGNTGAVKAKDATELTNTKVTDFNITNDQGVTPDDGFYSYNRVNLSINWDASSYGNDLVEGDYFNIKLPDNFKFPTNSTACNFDLYAPDGSVMAKAVVSPNDNGGGTIKVTFTNYVNDRSNIKGTVKLAASFYKVKTNQKNTFTLTVEGETKTIEVNIKEAVGLKDEVLSKWASMNDSNDTTTVWSGRINWVKKDLKNAVITDTLSTKDGNTDGIKFIPGSFKLYEVEFDEKGNTLKSEDASPNDYTVEYSSDYKTMTVKLNNTGTKQFNYVYRTTFVKGKIVVNTMKMTAEGVGTSTEATYKQESSSGNGDGDLNSKIIISKVDSENKDTKLAGATFVITNKSTKKTYEITTGTDGQVVSEKLTPGEYEVKETKAPTGYTINSDIKSVKVEADSKTPLTFEDTPEKISFSVKKEWKGETGKSVTIYLLRNGTRTGQSLNLNASNGWGGEFKDLRKTDSSGKAYTYSVEEEKMDGYTSSVTGGSSCGFIVTNVRSGKTSVSGIKEWNDANNQDGIRPSEITVNLMRNGVKVDSQKVNTQTNWKYNFTNLDQYDSNGNPYVYTVTEDNVPGYTTTYTSLGICNKYTPETTSATVTKQWSDDNNQDGIRPDSIKVQLYANGEKHGDEVTLTNSSKWTHTWTNLPVKKEGKKITYTVKEVNVPKGYEVSYDTKEQGNMVISNKHTSEKTQISGKKTWDDQDDQDGVRPSKVVTHLLADGQTIETQTVKKGNWSYHFDDLPVYKNGKRIIYTITEDRVAGYTTQINGYNITNKRTPDQTSATVTKQWLDSDNQDGVRPESVKVQLYANGEKYGDEVSLSRAEQWTHTWAKLPAKKSGKTIVYTVKEVSTPAGYTTGYITSNTGNMIITNTHVTKTTKVEGTKTWDDHDNQDGVRPDAVIVNLLANGKVVKSMDVSAKTNWKYSFDNLPENQNGKKIVYTVTENSVSGYTTQINGYNITNKRTPDTTSATVTKTWNDGNNQDGIRVAAVNVQLYANGEKVGDPVSLKETSNWTYTWTNLPAKKNGKTIVYTVKEDVPNGYSATYDTQNLGNMTITNTHQPTLTSVSGVKTWDDQDNQDGVRPSSVSVNLLANGQKIATASVSSKTDWKYTFTNLPVYQNGQKIVYTVTENSVPGYTTNITGTNITNKRTPDTTSATVTKRWNDHNDQDGKRPSSIKVQLYANGDEYGDKVSVTKSSKWTYTWTNLPAKKNGKAITYTVKEDVPNGYSATYDTSDQGNMIITNTHTSETTSVEGHKEWDDQNNHDGVRPSSVTVNLLADGVIQSSVVVSAKTNWSYSFKNLPVYNNGQKIVYSVTENSVLGYSTSIDGYNIVNTRTPKTTSATVTKQWDDSQNQDGLRPEVVNVQLYANGQKYGDVIKLTENAKWTYTWMNLPVMKDGKKVTYSVKEVGVPQGYTSSVDNNNHGNMIIVNSHMPVSRVQNKVKTGDSTNYMKYVLLAALSSVVILIWIFMKHKKTI